MARRDVTDAELLEALTEGWLTADAIWRSFRLHLYDNDGPTVGQIGMRLSRLARQGLCEKAYTGGGGLYRRVTP